jgi:hypothetical protein
MIMNPPTLLIAGALLMLAVSSCPLGPNQAAADCLDPAPLLGEKSEAIGYIVVYRDGTPAATATEELARKYGFTPRHIYEHAILGFAADFSEAVLAAIRCEPVVKQVEYDRTITVR